MIDRLLRTALLVMTSLVLGTAPLAGQTLDDEQAIRKLATQFEQAWNTHDMTRLGEITTDDVDFVNVAGLHWKGQPEVIREHAERHKVRFRNSVWTTENVSVQFLGAGTALVHLDWQTRGDLDFELKPWPPRKGIFSWLVIKSAGGWKIRAVQNTDKS
jgi:uncharacterized protein (TIGR02246 family)